MRRKAVLLLLMGMLSLLAQGCWGSQEADMLGYVIVIGIDKGENSNFKITFQLALPQPMEGGSKGEGTTSVVSVEAPSLFAALELADTFVSKHLTLLHTKAVVVSAEVAKEGLSKYINPLVRSKEIRRTNYLLVTRGKAEDFLKENENLVFEKFPSRQFDILMSDAFYTGLVPRSDIHRFYDALKTPGRQPITALVGKEKKEEKGEQEQGKKQEQEQETKGGKEQVREGLAYLPGEIPREGGDKIEVIGMGVFKEDHLVGYLNGEETRSYQLLTGDFGSGIFTFPDPDPREGGSNIIVVEIKKGCSPKTEVNIRQKELKVKMYLEGEILSIQSGENYERGRLKKQLESYVETIISREATRLIHKTQEELGCDIFGFGEHSRVDFLTWQEWVDYDWLQKYPQYRVSVETEFHIRRTGMMTNTTPGHHGG